MNKPVPCADCQKPTCEPLPCEACGKMVCPDCEWGDENLLHAWCASCAQAQIDAERDPVELAEWQKHVNRIGEGGISWCGQRLDLLGEWCFQDPGHAILSVAQGQRLQPCPACVDALMAQLRRVDRGAFPPLPAEAQIVQAAAQLYDNRLGWSDGRNPYAPPELWDDLGRALGRDPAGFCAASPAPAAPVQPSEKDPKIEALYRACREVADNIAEFGDITDAEFLWDLEGALGAVMAAPQHPVPAGFYRPEPGSFDCDCGVCSFCNRGVLPLPDAQPDEWANIPPEIVQLVNQLGPVSWGQTEPQSAAEHAEWVAKSVEVTAEAFGQGQEPQPMSMLFTEPEGEEQLVIGYIGTSPNSPTIARALCGAWNRLVQECAAFALAPEERP